jgi:hypothetical protein
MDNVHPLSSRRAATLYVGDEVSSNHSGDVADPRLVEAKLSTGTEYSSTCLGHVDSSFLVFVLQLSRWLGVLLRECLSIGGGNSFQPIDD